MRNAATVLLLSIFTFTSITTTAGPVRRPVTVDSLPLPEELDDCISYYQKTDTVVTIRSGKGRSLEIIRGENGKVELVTQNGKSYRPIYDEFQMLASFKSLDDGMEHPVLSESETVHPEVQQRVKEIMDSVKPCPSAEIYIPKASDTESCLPPHIMYDAGESHLWRSDFATTRYWQYVHRPYYDAQVRTALDRTAQRTCVVRYTACIDACQNADDMRGYSCGAFGLIFIRFAVAAAIGTAACLYGSNRERNRCTNSCGAFVVCF